MRIEQVDDVTGQDPVFRMNQTRAALRDAAGADDRGDAFPRSRVLRLALSPRYRWITAAVAGAGLVAVWRFLPAKRVGVLVGAYGLAKRLRDLR